MNMLKLARSPALVVRRCPVVLLLAPKRCFENGNLPDLLDPAEKQLAVNLAADLQPGDRGASRGSVTSGRPRRLLVGVLPDEVSRYNTPARAAAVRHVVATADFGQETRIGIFLVLEDEAQQLAACNAVARALPRFDRRKTATRRHVHLLTALQGGKVLSVGPVVQAVLDTAPRMAELVDTPPTEMHPGKLAQEAQKLLRGIPGVRTRQVRGVALLGERLLGVHAVGRCAVHEPRLLVARYKPAHPRGPSIALVGKGITYDTGGLHLKMRGFMETMKADMGGAAAVLGAFRVLATTKLNRPLDLVLCLAENAIGPTAYKPDDILTLHSGKTVEINNTDAEGRLVLADGVSYAARKLKAGIVLDAATLTGAQLVATGTEHAAVMSNDADLEKTFVEAGRHSGDLTHPLPFAPEFYRAEFQSPVADLRNSVKNRANAQASCAGQFIYENLPDTDVRWLHVDMAGPAFLNGRATGYGVALFTEAVQRLARTPGGKR